MTRTIRPEQLAELAAIETDECVIWPHGTDNSGYGQIKAGRCHVIVCTQYHGPRPAGMIVCHRRTDGTACISNSCINPRHLRWDTYTGNSRDSKLHGTFSPPPRSAPKLTDEQITAIRARYAMGGVTHRSLAELFGVGKTTIWKIVRKDTR